MMGGVNAARDSSKLTKYITDIEKLYKNENKIRNFLYGLKIII